MGRGMRDNLPTDLFFFSFFKVRGRRHIHFFTLVRGIFGQKESGAFS